MPFSRECEVCGLIFSSGRRDARYCSAAHRNKAYRQRLRDKEAAAAKAAAAETRQSESPGVDPSLSPVGAATLAELTTAGKATSAEGLAAVALAVRIDHPERETGSSLAALVREHRSALTAALASGGDTGDVLDEIAKKREERQRAAGRR